MSASAFPDLNLASTENLASGSKGTLSSLFQSPFSFDHSAWNVSIGSSGSQSASGSTGQGSGVGGGALGGLGGIDPKMLLLIAAAYFILRKQ